MIFKTSTCAGSHANHTRLNFVFLCRHSGSKCCAPYKQCGPLTLHGGGLGMHMAGGWAGMAAGSGQVQDHVGEQTWLMTIMMAGDM